MAKDREESRCYSQLFVSRSVELRKFVENSQKSRVTNDPTILENTNFFTLKVISIIVILILLKIFY